MPTYIALLYSITIADGKRLIMSEFKQLAEELGYKNPHTIVATGNLVFDLDRKTTVAKLETQLETAIKERFGRSIDTIVLAAEDFRKLAESNPFPEQSKADASHVIVRVMRNPPQPEIAEALKPYAVEGELIRIAGGHLWVYFANDIGHSKLAAAMTPKRAGGIGTSRNWNTIVKIEKAL